ncbi:MAG: rhomboid family intramembrane serine protease [Planctomycetes bacterium]|nr:rhomboid family intramembrane serine protease [Planctomycetota bacterium]
MSRIGNRLPSWATASAVHALITINVAVFAVTVILGERLGGRSLDHWLALNGEELLAGYGLGLLRLVSYQFAHSFTDPFHVLFNMLLLWWFGRRVEDDAGSRGLVHIYLMGGLLGGILQLVIALVGGHFGAMRLVGASGAVYAIMVYCAMATPRLMVMLLGLIPVQLGLLVGILVALGAYYSLMELHGLKDSGTAHAAHLGGAIWGFCAFRVFRGYYLALGTGRGTLFPALARWRKRRAQVSQAEREFRLDEILDKVAREGRSALSAEERRFLERASKDLRGR